MVKILSLFSGIGAFEKALENIDIEYDLVNYCEVEERIAYSYSVVHEEDIEKNLGDIRKVNPKDIPDFDLMTYGFPCTDISLMGKKRGFDKGSNTKSSLLWEAMDIAKEKRPKYMLAENVPNLVYGFRDDFGKWFDFLSRELGYRNYWKVLNARDYGLPQGRERVFIMSIREDLDVNFKFPDRRDYVKLDDFLLNENEVVDKYYIDKDLFIQTDDVKRVGCDIDVVGKLDKSGFESGKKVYNPEGIAPTITTSNKPKIIRTDKYYSPVLKKDDYILRKMTPAECLRVQGFEYKDYYLVKKELEKEYYNKRDRTDSIIYTMAGNTIPVKVLEVIFKNLFLK